MSISSDNSKYSKKYSSDELEKDVIKLLEDNPHGLNINQIAQQLEINRNTISKWLKTLEAKNKIISRKIGVSNLFYKSESKNTIDPGPYVIVIEYSKLQERINAGQKLKSDQKIKRTDKFTIKQCNQTYLNRINEIKESLNGTDLFKYSPFKEYSDYLYPVIYEAISEFKKGNIEEEEYLKKISFPGEDDKNESYIFKIYPDKANSDFFQISFQDLSLLQLLEDQLLNSDSISIILDLINDKYVTIQAQDSKVLMANKLTLDTFNNGKEITSEPIYCLDLFNLKLKEKDKKFVGIKAIETNRKEEAHYLINNHEYKFTAIPIKALESDLIGYILIVAEM